MMNTFSGNDEMVWIKMSGFLQDFYIKIIFSIFRPQTQSTRAVITLDIGEPPTTQITDQKLHWLIVKILFPVQNNNLKIFSNPKLNYYFNLNKFWL